MHKLNIGLAFTFVATAAIWVGTSGCRRDTPQVVAAELLEVGDTGYPQSANGDPVLVVTVDRLVAKDELATSIHLEVWPPASLAWEQFEPTDRPTDTLFFVVHAGAADIEPNGVFLRPNQSDDGSTGLGVNIGYGVQWVDVQPRPSHPVLQRAVWHDTDGDYIVSSGDTVALSFTRTVVVDDRQESDRRTRAPEDIVFANPDDRLDNGEQPSYFRVSDRPDYIVEIILGSSPLLYPRHRTLAKFLHDNQLSRTTMLAVNGTPILPHSKISDVKSGLGVISRKERYLELPQGYPQARTLADRLPSAPGVVFPSASLFSGRGVLLCGGWSEERPRDEIHLFTPAPPGEKSTPKVVARLNAPRFLHTVTSLPGSDGVLDTGDDIFIVAGGFNGEKSLSSLESIRIGPSGSFTVQTLPDRLRFSRYYHTATFVPPNRILFIGGRDVDDAIVGIAELVSFGLDDDGSVVVTGRSEKRLLARSQHTATTLGDSVDQSLFVLLYGGIGLDPYVLRQRSDPKAQLQESLSPNSAAILGAPELLRIDLAALTADPDNLTDAITWRRIPFPPDVDYTYLRYGHTAVEVPASETSVDESGNPEGGNRAEEAIRRVLIAGGSLRPREIDAIGIGLRRSRWQLLFDYREVTEDVATLPQGNECAHALVFEWSPSRPGRTRLTVIRSPSAEPRVHHGAISIPGHGVLILGGESPEREGGSTFLDAELYRPDSGPDGSGTLVPIPLTLRLPKSKFATCVLRHGDAVSLYLFGGATDANYQKNLPAIEEIRFE